MAIFNGNINISFNTWNNSYDKDDVCEEYNIDLFIDDSIDHVRSANKKNIRGILYTSKYNKNIKDLERIDDWNELLDIL